MTTSESTKKRGAADGFTPEERAAMKDRAAEARSSSRRGGKASREDGERELLAKIAVMEEPDRSLAQEVHAVVTATAPELMPQTYYGMPAYAKDGKVLCFFKPGGKFKMRYSTFGFTDRARLDEGDLWASEFALQRWSDEVASRLAALVRQAAG